MQTHTASVLADLPARTRVPRHKGPDLPLSIMGGAACSPRTDVAPPRTDEAKRCLRARAGRRDA
ncbi:hypothetical protein [Streptomyces sp. NPDC056670]|uniref:hypothetical protein n=1 Tax=Streptomyces sp. NPDC056670 TaxID=3345904 RepID=UPI0036A3A771